MSFKLNKEQKEAVKHEKGPLLIIAGAGTGKTTVITERINYLIVRKKLRSSEILALTFTEKSAREMEERVDKVLPLGYSQMWISTFHSFCDRILRSEALNIGLDPGYILLTQAGAVKFLRDNIFEFELEYFRPLGNPTKFVSALLQHFSRLQDEDVTPDQYVSWVNLKFKNVSKTAGWKSPKPNEEERTEYLKWKELAHAYKKYDELKSKRGLFDFGDLITKTLKLFRERKNVLKKFKEQFKYVLVDEFQDTNVAQYELLKLLCPPKSNPNLTVVGDDSQSIYKFRGAAVSNIIHFMENYKMAKTCILTKNYRSIQNILDASYKLIKFNDPDTLEAKIGVSKNLVSQVSKAEEEGVCFIHEKRVEDEAEAVAVRILKLTGHVDLASKNIRAKYNHNFAFSDIAVLVRANNHSDPFMSAFRRKGIPFQFLGPGKLFKQTEVINLISYLRILANPEDNAALYKVLSADFLEIKTYDLIRFTNYAKRRTLFLYEALKDIKNIRDLYISKDTAKKLELFAEKVERHIKLVNKETSGQILYRFLEDFDILPKLLNPDSLDSQVKAKNISRLFDKIKTYEIEHPDASVFSFLDYVDLASELGESPLASDSDWTQNDAVNILTVHASKGLEFPVVFLVNLVSQRFPTMERKEQIPIPEDLIKEILPEGDFHIQEERRLFYVGMTRAKEKLFLTAANFYGEGIREKKLSPFIFESLGEKAYLRKIFKKLTKSNSHSWILTINF
jgi:DNA helicase II / ATP-dependent DNA helicase PcrA